MYLDDLSSERVVSIAVEGELYARGTKYNVNLLAETAAEKYPEKEIVIRVEIQKSKKEE